jgi:hypothetical protein
MLANEFDRKAEMLPASPFHALAHHVRKPRRGRNENAAMNGVLSLAPAVCPRTPTAHWIFCFGAFRMRLGSLSILRFCCDMPPYSPGVYRAGNSIVGPWSRFSPLASHLYCVWRSGDEDPHIPNFGVRRRWVVRRGCSNTGERTSVPIMQRVSHRPFGFCVKVLQFSDFSRSLYKLQFSDFSRSLYKLGYLGSVQITSSSGIWFGTRRRTTTYRVVRESKIRSWVLWDS